MCQDCHGGPGAEPEEFAAGMNPRPPNLAEAAGDLSVSEVFWIEKHGLKMTGMPSWRNSLSDGQIWDVVAFLEAMRQLPPQTYVEWRSRRMCTGFKGPWPAPEPSPPSAQSSRG